ncbi:MAG: hypothetical protein ACK4NC_00750 [Candidatus Gracilibacteria bacterium]
MKNQKFSTVLIVVSLFSLLGCSQQNELEALLIEKKSLEVKLEESQRELIAVTKQGGECIKQLSAFIEKDIEGKLEVLRKSGNSSPEIESEYEKLKKVKEKYR